RRRRARRRATPSRGLALRFRRVRSTPGSRASAGCGGQRPRAPRAVCCAGLLGERRVLAPDAAATRKVAARLESPLGGRGLPPPPPPRRRAGGLARLQRDRAPP